MLTIYFLINTIENALFTVFLFLSGSDPSGQVLFGLSAQRLILVIIFSIISLFTLVLSVCCGKKESTIRKKLNAFLDNERGMWPALAGSLILLVISLMLLTQEASRFGDLRNIYLQLQPILSWLFLIAGQTVFVLLVRISSRIVARNESANMDIPKETGILWLIFAVSVTLKLMFVTPSAYGPVGGDEMEYFSLAYYLGQGNVFRAVDPIHYPLLYPALLVPTIPFGIYTYDLIKILNVLLSSSIVFPIYLIARQHMDARQSTWIAAASCLIPFHLVFPNRIQSENLYFPLFYWVIFTLLSAPKNDRQRVYWDILSGLLVGALYLTRYITLAILPVFLLGWWLKPQQVDEGKSGFSGKKIMHFLVVCGCALLAYLPWVLMGIQHGYSMRDTLGLFITSIVENPAQLNFANLMKWALIYLCYLILMTAPILPLIFISIRNTFTNQATRHVKNMLILLGSILAFYTAVVIRHSWRANYNAEMPMKIMGRYFVFVLPLILIGVIAGLPDKDKMRKQPGWRLLVESVLLPAALLVFSYCLLIQKTILPISPDAINKLGSVDAYLVAILGSWFLIITGLSIILIGYFYWKGDQKNVWVVLSIGTVVFYLLGLPAYQRELRNAQNFNHVGKEIAEILVADETQNNPQANINLLLPDDLSSTEAQRVYMSVQVRGFFTLTPATYHPSRELTDVSENTIVLWKTNQSWQSDLEPLEIMDLPGQTYQLLFF